MLGEELGLVIHHILGMGFERFGDLRPWMTSGYLEKRDQFECGARSWRAALPEITSAMACNHGLETGV
jgi:hypothetical protein